jgi:hypothetical protein
MLTRVASSLTVCETPSASTCARANGLGRRRWLEHLGEINRVVDLGSLENFRWRCYEGQPRSRATTATT